MILSTVVLGYLLFANTAGFGATVVAGVAISQITSRILERLTERR